MKALRYYLLFFLLPFLLNTLNAQNKLLTIEDVSGARSFLHYPEYNRKFKEMMQLQWRPGTDFFTYVRDTNLYQAGIKSKADDKIILNLSDFNKNMVKQQYGRVSRFPVYKWTNINEFWFVHKGQILIYHLRNGNIRIGNCCKADADNLEVEPNSLNLAYTLENNLFVSINPEGSFRITDDEDKAIVNGQSVSRVEFGGKKGAFWSPNGNYLAFYRKDESQVKEYPIMKLNVKPSEVEMIRYPMSGQPSEVLSVGVFDIKTKETLFLKTEGDKEAYLTNVTWSPDEKYLYIAELNRKQNHMKLNVYDASNGDFVKTLFEEKSNKYVEPMNGIIFFQGKQEFLWLSKKCGYNHLYRYNTEGELIEKLTDGKFDVISFEGFDEKEHLVYYIGVDEDYPLQRNAYVINIESKEVIRLSTAEGIHEILPSHNKDYFLDIYSSAAVPEEIALIDKNGMIIRKVYTGENTLKDYAIGAIRSGSIKASDGSDLFYRLMLPPDFNESEKYPVIVYVYGGPHSQMVSNKWLYGARLWMLYMAQQGFIVFTLDNRGTAYRGNRFEQAIHRDLGSIEMEDQLKGVDFLKTLPYVDENRMGVHGWSYGGFMTLTLLLRAPDVFKVGIAGAPVTDWSMYEVMYGERYMGTPEDNPEGYEKSNTINYIDQLKAKLLIIHGTSDDIVVWQHTLKFIEQSNRKGVMVDYHVYPGHKHAVRGLDRLHLDKMMSEYFIKHLK